MGVVVTKFGGSSLANAEQVSKVLDIVRSDLRNRFVVPSAPGKRHSEDEKVTDLLLHAYSLASHGKPADEVLDYAFSRYRDIIRGLDLDLSLEDEFEIIRERIASGASRDYCASRGEYLCGKLLAAALGYEFVDPVDCIYFNERGNLDQEKTHAALSRKLGSVRNAVVPGFYGADPQGQVHVFSRGGSDVTGAIVARAVSADVYENWTDVSGFLMADPRIVPNARTISILSYRELRELSYMGANVLHEDSIFPVRHSGIPIHIRNTNRPQDPGTLIVNRVPKDRELVVTGIAGRKDFTVITLEKAMMNSEVGFGMRALNVLDRYNINFEHLPSGIDTLSIVLNSREVEPVQEELLRELQEVTECDHIEVSGNLALIATVGHGMVSTPGTSARLFSALAQAGINVRMIDQGSSELNIIVGVDGKDFEKAVAAIYDAFV